MHNIRLDVDTLSRIQDRRNSIECGFHAPFNDSHALCVALVPVQGNGENGTGSGGDYFGLPVVEVRGWEGDVTEEVEGCALMWVGIGARWDGEGEVPGPFVVFS